MTKKHKQWLKEHEPWNYESQFGDPVTGRTDSGDDGCYNFIIAVILAGLITCGIISLF